MFGYRFNNVCVLVVYGDWVSSLCVGGSQVFSDGPPLWTISVMYR